MSEDRKGKLQREQMQRAWPWMVWLVLVLLVDFLVIPGDAPLWLRISMGLLVVPSILVARGLCMRLVARLDEMRQRIEYQAMAFTFVVTLCVLATAMVFGQMHVSLGLMPALWLFWLFFGSYFLARKFLERRYR